MLLFSLFTKGQVARYMLMPEILPRIRSFIDEGFKSLAVFMALVYRSVRLLPENHPYVSGSFAQNFTIRDVITAASKELKFNIKHIDQIIVFFSLIAGMILLALQFVILFAAVFINSASAADMPSNYRDFFNTPNPDQDLALRILDSVFGVPGIFNSSAEKGTPFHDALQGLFQFYSIGLLVVAGIILAYFIFVVLAETAQTGTPFGKRYNHAWAPIRLVAGIALLIPISSGLNSAQWITLYAAKFGSGFATVGWNKFNEEVQDNFIEKEQTVGAPNVPELKDLAAFMMTAHTCREAYKITHKEEIGNKIKAYIFNPNNNTAIPIADSPMLQDYENAKEMSKGGVIQIIFGVQNDNIDFYKDHDANIFPFCGRLSLVANDPFKDDGGSDSSGADDDGFSIIEARYFFLVARAWSSGNDRFSNTIREEALKIATKTLTNEGVGETPDKSIRTEVVEEWEEMIEQGIDIAIPKITNKINEDEEFKKYGWGGAGIWYNRIANVNGRLTTAVLNKPQIKQYAFVMELTCKENRQNNSSTIQNECYYPSLSKGAKIHYDNEKDQDLATTMNESYQFWYDTDDGFTNNVFIDTINAILGTEGIFSLCKNADIHPIAQLSVAGKGLVEAAIRNIGFSIGGGLAAVIPYFGPVSAAAGGFFGSIASIGLLIGFILYYMVPLLPFLYFFFAVGTWVRGIFEAMVGVPLWALAHIRIDGEGLPGQAASTGYFLIFEVFVRPILILFGLLASVLIFAAMVKILNEVFYLVASNASGFGGESATTCGQTSSGGSPTGETSAVTGSAEYYRGPIDQFFFTVLYAIIVYLTAMSSFKLIDMIPNKILRWMGSGDKTFSDDAGQTAEGVLTKVAVGGSLLGGQIGGVAQGAGKSVTEAGTGAYKLATEE